MPHYLAGRDAIISDLVDAFDRQTRAPELTTLISGVRGTGKTALLSRIAQVAEAHGWISAVRMNKSSGYVNIYKRRMLALGIIGERRRGVVGFDLPGFREFLIQKVG